MARVLLITGHRSYNSLFKLCDSLKDRYHNVCLELSLEHAIRRLERGEVFDIFISVKDPNHWWGQQASLHEVINTLKQAKRTFKNLKVAVAAAYFEDEEKNLLKKLCWEIGLRSFDIYDLARIHNFCERP